MERVYSQFYVLHRLALLKEKSATFRQVLLHEGDTLDNSLYMVYSGQVVLKKRVALFSEDQAQSKVKAVAVAVLNAGLMFNEQALMFAIQSDEQKKKLLQQSMGKSYYRYWQRHTSPTRLTSDSKDD